MLAGCDPEVILEKAGQPISAIGLIPGYKENPFDIGCGSIHPDNVLAEFNTIPADNATNFTQGVQDCLGYLTELVSKQGCTISKNSVDLYDKTFLQHPDARTAGCAPDFNAWYNGSANVPPRLDSDVMRSAGGHLHFGVDLNPNDICKFIQTCDLFITLPILKAEHPARRELYGKAGSFRVKPYGVEYRTPSNAWIFNTNSCNWIFEQMQRVVDEYQHIVINEPIDQIINNHDLQSARQVMSNYNIPLFPTRG